MKKILKLSLLLITLTIVSCRKEQAAKIKNVILNVTISAGTLYTLDLSQYGDADDLVEIVTQATTYTKSEITQSKMPAIYTFLKDGNPKVVENGNEVVVLKVYEPPTCRKHLDQTNITINFSIL